MILSAHNFRGHVSGGAAGIGVVVGFYDAGDTQICQP